MVSGNVPNYRATLATDSIHNTYRSEKCVDVIVTTAITFRHKVRSQSVYCLTERNYSNVTFIKTLI